MAVHVGTKYKRANKKLTKLTDHHESAGSCLVYRYIIIFSWFIKIGVGELTSPQVDQSATWLSASWFVGELPCTSLAITGQFA